MTEIVLCCGRVCSGKSTYARSLEESQGYVRFSADAWMLHFYQPTEDRAEFDDQLNRCQSMIRTQAALVLAGGRSVVVDDGFWTKQIRKAYREHFEALGYTVRLEYFPVDLPTQVQRALKRQTETVEPQFVFDEGTIRTLNALFEEPGPGEGYGPSGPQLPPRAVS